MGPIMDHTDPDDVRRAIRILPCSLVMFSAVLSMTAARPVLAEDWVAAPTIGLAEVYTDNVTLAAEGSEQEDFVTEVTPGIRVYRAGRRIDVNVDYRIQNLLYAEDSDRNETFHQLMATADAELVDEHFFLESQASVGQRVPSPEQGITFDNINATGNRTDEYALRLSPYYRQNLARFAEARFRYTYSGVRYEDGPSDSDSDAVDVSFSNGQRFRRLTWGLAYHNNELDRNEAQDLQYERASGEAAYLLTEALSFVVQGGYENNDIPVVAARSVEDGTYWAGGFSWRPNARTELVAIHGDRLRSASITWGPSILSSFSVTWRDRDVGLNPGEVWNARARWSAGRALLQAGYFEDTITTQQYVATTRYLNTETNQIILNPAPGEPVVALPAPILTLTDEVYERRRGDISIGWSTGKTNAILSLYQEDREYLETLDDETARGLSALWNWRLMPRSHLVVDGRWQRSEFLARDDEDEDWYARLALNRRIRRQADASLAYSHAARSSSTGGREYQENRVTLRMDIQF